jgi:excisionase family DNA binding protein
MSRFLTPTEVAVATGYSRRWVLRQIELGRLRAIAFDAAGRRSYRVRDTELAAFRAEYLRDARELPRRDEA